ncbi:MAG: hypothetical protein DRH12_17405 [Deltaproteobacteria bacterium]|nr:MAG: hypothetical protein DRH12_17405 [Deltaproteobacteria bacterium]
MKILILSQYFPPDITAAAFRVGETAEILAARGHDLIIITAQPHKGKAEHRVVVSGFSEERFYRTKVLPIGSGGFRRYLQHYMSFFVGSVIQGMRCFLSYWKPDVLWVTSPPLFAGISGYCLAKLFSCRWVLDIRDIWPESAVAAGQISDRGIAYRLGKDLERKLYNKADHLTCVSKPMSKYLQQNTPKPVTTLYNGVKADYLLQTTHRGVHNRILYAGNLGLAQGLDVLMYAFLELKDQGDLSEWELILVGAGSYEKELRGIKARSSYGHNVRILPPMAKTEVLREMAYSRILFMNLKGDNVFKLTIPSKVFDYLLADRPILAGLEGEGREILVETGGNICFEPSNKEDLKEKLLYIIAHISELEEKATYNSQYVKKHFPREKSVKKLESVFKQVTEKANS